jgi:hypothetical protein
LFRFLGAVPIGLDRKQGEEGKMDHISIVSKIGSQGTSKTGSQRVAKKLIIRIGGMLTCLALVSSPTFAANTEGQTTTTQQQTAEASKKSFMILQCAQEARIEQIADKPNSYMLTLKNINPNVSYITQKPLKKTGVMPNERYLQEWNGQGKNSLNNNPPKAFLHGLLEPKKDKPDANGKTNAKSKAKINQPTPEPNMVNVAFQLSEPRLDTKTSTMTYVINSLEGRDNSISPTTLRYITVFIDAIPCASCW